MANLVLEHNRDIRKRIESLEQERVGMSYGHVDYLRITADIQSLALQLKAEPHWSTVPSFWVSVVAMISACIAAYYSIFPDLR
jgi:hypothetical protein